MSRTPADILHDFALVEPHKVPADLLAKRVQSLAEFAAAYDASFNKLSALLQQRTRQRKTAEAREVEAQRVAEAARVEVARYAAVITAARAWYDADGTTYRWHYLEKLLAEITALFTEPGRD